MSKTLPSGKPPFFGSSSRVARELKAHAYSYAFILCAIAIAGFIFSIILAVTNKRNVFPKASQRYDVRSVFVGQMTDFCPEEFRSNPGREQFERCIPKLNFKKMSEVSIPSFDEVADYPPDFISLLRGKAETASLLPIFQSGNIFVIGIRLPDSLFQNDPGYLENGAMRPNAESYPVLNFHGLRTGRICVSGRCDFDVYEGKSINHVPLIRPRTGGDDVVWIFGVENEKPIGIALSQGIFVASSKDLRNSAIVFGLAQYGNTIIASVLCLALLLVSLPMAVYLRQFQDYPVFTYFAASAAFWFIAQQTTSLMPRFAMERFYFLLILSTLNFIVASFALSLSHSRFERNGKRVPLLPWVAAGFLTSLGVAIVATTAVPMNTIRTHWPYIQLAFAITLSVGSLMPLAFGILDLREILSKQHDPRESVRLDRHRRIRELTLYLVIWSAFLISYFAFLLSGIGTSNHAGFSSASITAFTSILGVMLYFTHSKEITHIAVDPIAEVERLQKRMLPEDFSGYLARNFQGVLIAFDLGGSSDKSGRTVRKVMDLVLLSLYDDLKARNFFPNTLGSAGDDWILTLLPKNESVRQDLQEILGLWQERYFQYLEMIRHEGRELSFHVSVIGLSDYTIDYIARSDKYANLRHELEFNSKEANLILKFLNKTEPEGTILVAATESLFPPALPESTHLEQTLLGKQELKANYLELAERLRIRYAYVKPFAA